MKIIELTEYEKDKPIYINIEKIGYFYEGVISEMSNGVLTNKKYTRIGHSDTVSRVKETPEEIIQKIRLIKNANSTQII